METVPALKVHDLHKRFGEVEVLKGVHLDAHVGDVISMLGASGSGKSTFLRCINLLETPDSGSIMVISIVSPWTVIEPLSGVSSRLMQRRNVLLPDPDAPSIEITSPT